VQKITGLSIEEIEKLQT